MAEDKHEAQALAQSHQQQSLCRRRVYSERCCGWGPPHEAHVGEHRSGMVVMPSGAGGRNSPELSDLSIPSPVTLPTSLAGSQPFRCSPRPTPPSRPHAHAHLHRLHAPSQHYHPHPPRLRRRPGRWHRSQVSLTTPPLSCRRRPSTPNTRTTHPQTTTRSATLRDLDDLLEMSGDGQAPGRRHASHCPRMQGAHRLGMCHPRWFPAINVRMQVAPHGHASGGRVLEGLVSLVTPMSVLEAHVLYAVTVLAAAALGAAFAPHTFCPRATGPNPSWTHWPNAYAHEDAQRQEQHLVFGRGTPRVKSTKPNCAKTPRSSTAFSRKSSTFVALWFPLAGMINGV